jgi:hypothetical protein
VKSDPVVRVSIGHFDPDDFGKVRDALKASQEKLVPGIRSMNGNRSYFVGINRENSAMINVSSWDSVNSAKEMDRFQPMLDLVRDFIAMGVRFERPILNFESVWMTEDRSQA